MLLLKGKAGEFENQSRNLVMIPSWSLVKKIIIIHITQNTTVRLQTCKLG
jgi:hypothetical protein